MLLLLKKMKLRIWIFVLIICFSRLENTDYNKIDELRKMAEFSENGIISFTAQDYEYF